MCGIFGIVSGADKSTSGVDREKFLSALRTIKHRGPDHLGHHFDPVISFGHARLSILDLDPRSNQPMFHDGNRYCLTFNGEIYNFHSIRNELIALGETFLTECDTEVILVGHKVWGGEKFLEKALGMFAYALYDKVAGTVFFARDRFGKKPLFYYVHENELAFASELAPLFHYYPRFRLNPVGLDAYLTLNFSPSNEHLVEGIRSIPPGSFGVLDVKTLDMKIQTYWNPLHGTTERTQSYSLEEMEREIERAVEDRLISDVPVCGFLSGGIDSSLISAMVAGKTKTPYRTYCIGYEGQEKYNEFEYADLVAKKYNLDHKNITVSLEDAKEVLMSVGNVLDEPISNWVWVPLHLLSSRVREDGYKVVLVGEGADELFYGYNSFGQNLKYLKAARSQPWKFTVPHHLLGFLSKYAMEGHRRFDLWRRVAEKDPVYMGTSFGITKTLRNQLAGPALLERGDPGAGYDFMKSIEENLRRDSQGKYDDIDLISYTEIYGKMIEVLVRRVDRITMLSSIEARAPFLDQRVAELAFKTMGEGRTDGGKKKALLKKIARKYVPAECIDRKKMGFSFPFEQWLYGDMGSVVHERFQESRIFKDGWLDQEYSLKILGDHRNRKRDYAPRIWSLYTLATWYDRWM